MIGITYVTMECDGPGCENELKQEFIVENDPTEEPTLRQVREQILKDGWILRMKSRRYDLGFIPESLGTPDFLEVIGDESFDPDDDHQYCCGNCIRNHMSEELKQLRRTRKSHFGMAQQGD